MDIASIRRQVLNFFKLNGYSVTSEAAGYLASQLQPLDAIVRKKWLSTVVEKIPNLQIDSLVLQKEHLENCLLECTSDRPTAETVFNVIDCLNIPRFSYDKERDKFLKCTDDSKAPLFAPASVKSLMYRRRYSLILQRIRRHESFRERINNQGNPQVILRNAEYFLCTSEKKEGVVMLGLLVQRGDGNFYLEDPTGAVKLELSRCKFGEGLFTEFSFVLAEGVYDDKFFYISRLGLPPAELARQSRPYFGTANTFGGTSDTNLAVSATLAKIEGSNPYAKIFFLADVWLDDMKVMNMLRIMLEKCVEYPPVAFVIMGNFLTQQPDASYAQKLHSALKNLAATIASVPQVCQTSHFVLVPGSSDPGSSLVFPRSPLPKFMAEEIHAKVPNLTLASNPCRIQYCTKEIVVIREDLLTKLSRNNLNYPITGDIFKQFAMTLISQATILPLPQHITPVHWGYSHGLDLYPLPNLIVVGDQFTSFTIDHKDCIVTNPGSFKKTGFSFRAYTPASNTVEEMKIPEEE